MEARVFEDIEVSVEPRIAVVGIGGAGCNVVTDIYESCCPVDTIAINTDKDALSASSADRKLYICKAVTKGEGARGDAGLGRQCAKVHEDEIRDALRGHDAVFIIAGMGGGTGSGAAAVVAELSQGLNLITFTVAVNPFSFESARIQTAAEGLRHVKAVCPLTVTVENDLVLKQLPNATMNEAFKAVNASIIDFIGRQRIAVTRNFLDAVRDSKIPDTKDRAVPDLRIRFGMSA